MLARKSVISLVILSSFLLITGCKGTLLAHALKPSMSADEKAALTSKLHEISNSGNLPELRWPNFTDYRAPFQHAYETSNFAPLWLNDREPSPQALAMIQLLQASEGVGLKADDYDAGRWQDRLKAIESSPTADTLAYFDAELTVSAMRYISDLHVGRVNPKYFDFRFETEKKKYNLAEFLTGKVIHAGDVKAALVEVEPPFEGYKRTKDALHHYQELKAKGDGPTLPTVEKTVLSAGNYSHIKELALRLKLLEDLPQDAIVDDNSNTYTPALADAVKHFQERHGLQADGGLSKKTVEELNVPLAARVDQLQYALERWRWLPSEFNEPPIVVNIPEFMVRVYGADQKVVLEMPVVTGKAAGHQTPIFGDTVRFIVFRPYWEIPRSIVKDEVIPGIVRNRGYIAKRRYEVTDSHGGVIADGDISDEVLAMLRSGHVGVRQRPGPGNALGLIKFLFPNDQSVYMHSTPEVQLFGRTRRDYSHGCIRVQKPVDLATYLLRDQAPWTREKIEKAMQSGDDNQWLTLKTPVPVLVFYVTASTEENGEIRFLDDIYGLDERLKKVLDKGMPYPGIG